MHVIEAQLEPGGTRNYTLGQPIQFLPYVQPPTPSFHKSNANKLVLVSFGKVHILYEYAKIYAHGTIATV